VIDNCPGITEGEVEQIAGILANLEQSSSKYGLITKLHELKSGQLDDLHQLLDDWTITAAKAALDELQARLKLIHELDVKLRDENADEVKDLQPLFENSLWVFGPQFETIEYTSNKGMTTVIRNLLGVEAQGSLQRPDFVIIPDGSVGFYSRDSYGEDYEVEGVESLVIAEIKKPGIAIGTQQLDQALGYATELIKRGSITPNTPVACFVLGSKLLPIEAEETKRGRVTITPMAYDTFIRRAEKRMLGLREKLKGAPFLQGHGLDAEGFLTPPQPKQPELWSVNELSP
jgi:hypothetical protein